MIQAILVAVGAYYIAKRFPFPQQCKRGGFVPARALLWALRRRA